MVQAIISIDAHTNQILNIVKAKYDLKDKSEAIEMMAKEYEESVLQPELRPAYVKKAKSIMEEKAIDVEDVDGLRKRLGLKK
jgi:hypothetical protein